jgi:hypothetical protein
MKTPETEHIAERYRAFFDLANELADKDLAKYPKDKHEYQRERFEKHLIGMMQMYDSTFGNPALENAWQSLKSYFEGRKDTESLCYISSLELKYKIGKYGEFAEAIVGGK